MDGFLEYPVRKFKALHRMVHNVCTSIIRPSYQQDVPLKRDTSPHVYYSFCTAKEGPYDKQSQFKIKQEMLVGGRGWGGGGGGGGRRFK